MAGHAGRGSIFQFGDGTAGSADTITAFSMSAGIGTVTATGHSLAVGDVVLIAAVVGMTNANGNQLVQTVADANTFTIENGTITGTYTSGGTATPLNTTWTTIPGVLDWTSNDVRAQIDVSALDTTGGRAEFVTGLSAGDWSLTLNWQPNAAAQGFATGLPLFQTLGTAFWQRLYQPQVSTNPPYFAYLGLLSTSNNSIAEKLGYTVSGPISGSLLQFAGS